ncbi:response regulator [Heliobacterium gestii]|uniref:Stage 0 sporulation protein A homolog n=1 Tax=Heliomicrobium gestii TaxID=2699 RepID=A0A845LE24_HELGE|nr:response regulator [Heliomicrobium gestii]MBM7866540.1 two-component system response regulator (stage 0 sporulation protein F) [Heliomicrobium gestii]MZP43180.1 response regulator [Heliomicrobium gestii]
MGDTHGVLVVDDQKGVRRLLQEAFRMAGIPVETAASGPEALEKLGTTEYSLMLIDVKMPGMTGVEALAEARRRGHRLRVVLMTAYEELPLLKEARDLDILDHVMKPFDVMELTRKILCWRTTPS